MTFNAKEEANRFVENFSGMTFSGTTGKEWLKDRLEKMLAIAHAAGLAQGRNEALEEAAKEVESLACGIIGASPEANNAIKGYIEKHISMCVRALKTPDGKEKSE